MPIISEIGRKSPGTRFLVISIFSVLLLGAVTMIYPFLLMLSGTSKSNVDTPDAVVIPRFLYNDTELYKKHLEGFFNESLEIMNSCYNTDIPSFRDTAPPQSVSVELVSEWNNFLNEAHLPFYCSELSYMGTPSSKGVIPSNWRAFKAILSERFNGDIGKMNSLFGTRYSDWNSVRIDPEIFLLRAIEINSSPSPMTEAWRKFKESRPQGEKYFTSSSGFFKCTFLKAVYENIDRYNQAHGTSLKSWNDLRISRRLPDGRSAKERTDWINFTRDYVNPVWIIPDDEAKSDYADYLASKYGLIGKLNDAYGTTYESFDKVPLFEGTVTNDIAMTDHAAFVKGWKDVKTGKTYRLPEQLAQLASIDFQFADHLRGKYGSIEKLNRTCGTSFDSWDAVTSPQREANYLEFMGIRNSAKFEFATRNFITVIDYLFLHGNALFNTLFYCFLSIAASLIINPISAYALSRYRPPSTYKILLFMMLTMAFPPLVTQIPVFLLLKNLGLLNTYWALVLPGLANGYSIFMLKGFFDSLPKELYESAQIDGAGELTIFWRITMSLSTPILAVIALGAFTGAYSNFMMALLLCQDQRMWTIMPWLYQLQTNSCQGVVFAALVIVAIPTMLVYSVCQNVIMRGIVVPVEK